MTGCVVIVDTVAVHAVLAVVAGIGGLKDALICVGAKVAVTPVNIS
jgi:hypothetical protein